MLVVDDDPLGRELVTELVAFRKLKADAATAGVPVVAVTATVMPGNDEEARDAGCDAYLTKPFDVKVFRDTLRRFPPRGGTGPPGDG